MKDRNVSFDDLANFYKPNQIQSLTFENDQVFDFQGLLGRVLSSSYVPTEAQSGYSEMLIALQSLFNKHQINRTVGIEHKTRLYFGQLS